MLLGEIKFDDLDVIVMRDTCFVSRVIQFFIGEWTHVAIATDTANIVHADTGFVIQERFGQLLSRCGSRVDFKVIGFRTIQNRRLIKEKLIERIGRRYDYRNAIARVFYRFARIFGVNRDKRSIFDDGRKDYCTELLGRILHDLGTEVRPDVHYTQLEPADYLAPDSTFAYKYSGHYEAASDTITITVE